MSDIALRPGGGAYAVLGKSKVFVVNLATGERSQLDLGASAGFHGIVWSPDGSRLIATTASGHLQTFDYTAGRLSLGSKIELKESEKAVNPVPGGLCVDARRGLLYVACANENRVKSVDLSTGKVAGSYRTQNLPFGCRLSADGKTLVVTNWGGEPPRQGDLEDDSDNLKIKVTPEGSAATGTVSLVRLSDGQVSTVRVGLHPTGVAISGRRAYVANSQSDSVTVVDLQEGRAVATWPITFHGKRVLGAMPDELAIHGDTLYVCDGGDNALCEMDLRTGRVKGYRPAGYFPTNVQVSADGRTAYVVNSKGNGSVRVSTSGGKRHNTHDFQGTVSQIDLTRDLVPMTAEVAGLNHWNDPAAVYHPKLKVYNGAIKHVIYVIKENRTYDEVFGDMPEGEGDPELCSLGETMMPNHRQIAREFGLFDNAYTCGTNSADGHQWCDQAMANEYLEHFYVGYSRTYPDDGEDAMALNASGRLWDAALRSGKTVRVYGEWAGDEQATYEPRKPADWFEAWSDRVSGRNQFRYKAHTRVGSLKPLLCPDYHYWPLIQSDQSRIDVFEREFRRYLDEGRVPSLMVLSLPSDHTEGTNPAYPTPRSMMADNDLALGRLLDLVSHSKVWRETCVFVTEDDSQGGPDHVDGHRTVNLVASPYSRRHSVNSEFSTQLSLLRSIEGMLGLKPLTRFDALARPLTECFTDRLDLSPYDAVPNKVPLGERNPSPGHMTVLERSLYERTMALDWTAPDKADPQSVSKIQWDSLHKGARPYPSAP